MDQVARLVVVRIRRLRLLGHLFAPFGCVVRWRPDELALRLCALHLAIL